MKKHLKTLAKELDFSSEQEYFDYLIDSHINGNFSQCRQLFAAMSRADQKSFLTQCEDPKIYKFYFDLL